MFTAVQSDAYRDGVFSHLNTNGDGRSYQASVRQFNEGSLGNLFADGARRMGQPRPRSLRAVRGVGEYFQGTSGLGIYQDGVLGDGSTTVTIGPDGASIGPTPVAPVVPLYKQPAVLACAAIAVAAAFFLYKKK